MNNKNLISLKSRTKEERKAIASKGGKASAEKARERKKLKEELELLLSDKDTLTRISTALIQQALNGNTKAYEVIRDTLGEKPKDNITLEKKEPIIIDLQLID